MSDKEKWENLEAKWEGPGSDIPEDAVSPGAILPKPARAEPKPVEIEQQEIRSPVVEPVQSPARTKDAEHPSTENAQEPFAANAQAQSANSPAYSKPKFGRRLLGFCLTAALGAAAVLGYQYWGPKPEVESIAACLERTIPDLAAAVDQKPRVILMPLMNDLENVQGGLVKTAISEFHGSGGPLMQVQTVDCALVGDAGSVLELATKVRENSLEIARKSRADILIWGEVFPDDERIELRINYATDTERSRFATDDISLKTNFGENQAAVFAADIWSTSDPVDRLDEDIVAIGMTAAREALLPISENPKPGLSLQQLGSLYHALGEAEYVLSLQSEDSDQLERSIAHFRSAGELLERYTFPDKWAQTQNDLGIALTTLGMKDNRNKEIGLALSAFQDAIVETPRSRNPLMWAQLHSHLAEALNALGTRDSNNQMLTDSIAAYRRALTVQRRENYPVQWATLQHNLGAALQGLGQRDGNPAILQDAVAAYRAALEVRTTEKLPKDHAITQINLGSTLMTIGARSKETDSVGEAIAAFRAAIDQLDKEKSAIEWATAQHSLGNALALIGERDGNADNLEDALTAFSLALDSFDKETDPTRWAVTQNNIGNVLYTLGESKKDPEAIAAAIVAYEAAVSILSESAPAYAERVVESLSRAQVLQQTMAQSN